MDAGKAGDLNASGKERRHDCSLCKLAYFHKGDLNRHVRMVRVESKVLQLDTGAIQVPLLLGERARGGCCLLFLGVFTDLFECK